MKQLVSAAIIMTSLVGCASAGNVTSSKSIDTMAEVNESVNHTIQYTSDREVWGKDDYWVANPPNNQGDCEDYVLTKLSKLLELGYRRKDFRITLTEDPYTGNDHAVLLYRKGGNVYVLDNLDDDILELEDSPYTWLYLEYWDNQWTRVFEDSDITTYWNKPGDTYIVIAYELFCKEAVNRHLCLNATDGVKAIY